MGRGARRASRGFTTVEMVVSIGMFIAFTLIVFGAFLSITEVARKARATRVALDNVSAAVDYMGREIRLGSYFRCLSGTPATVDRTDTNGAGFPLDCAAGGSLVTFEAAGKSLANSTDNLVFRLNNGTIERSVNSGTSYQALTSPEITISDMRFIVTGTQSGVDQPRIILFIKGVAGKGKVTLQVPFALQTTLSARTPNIAP